MEEHSQKVDGSYCPSAQCWEACTWNTAFSFELAFQKGCGETGQGPVKPTKMVKAWGTWSARRGKGSRADLADKQREGSTSSTGWKETEQCLRVAYEFLKGHYKGDRPKLFSLVSSVFTGFSCTKPWLSWSSPGDHLAPGQVKLETSKGVFPPALLWFLWFNFFESCFPMEAHFSPGCHTFTAGKKLS